MTDLPILAIDIDDTIAASTDALRVDINRRFSISIPAESYRVAGEYWGYYERVWEAHGVADEIRYADHLSDMAIDQSQVPLLTGADMAIHELSNYFRIVLITSRDVSLELATRAWFKNHFADINIDLYFTNNHRDTSALTKGQLCAKLGAKLLIDDNVEHCNSALAQGVDAVLFGDYGWHIDKVTKATICKDWPAVLEYLHDRK